MVQHRTTVAPMHQPWSYCCLALIHPHLVDQTWNLTQVLKLTLVQVMAWCHQATGHNLSQCWPRPLSLRESQNQRVLIYRSHLCEWPHLDQLRDTPCVSGDGQCVDELLCQQLAELSGLYAKKNVIPVLHLKCAISFCNPHHYIRMHVNVE